MHQAFKDRIEVLPDTDCWQWLQAKDKQGYGRIALRSLGFKSRSAHRVSYEIHVGPIPEAMTIDHLCFNTSCVNPAHMQLLTHTDNAKRQRSSFKTHCASGHPFNNDNTYMKPTEGQRSCRRCNADAVRRYTQRRRNKEQAA